MDAKSRVEALEDENRRNSLFSLSFRLRCCDREQMEYIVDSINDATKILLDEALGPNDE